MTTNTTDKTFCMRLFGVFSTSWSDGTDMRVRSAKLRAMLAMLAMAPEGTRTRAWLQDMLWSRSGHEHGRASLRRALTDLRSLLKDDFAYLFDVNNTEVTLNRSRVRILGSPDDGEFLEGLDIAEEGFEDWLRSQRQTGANTMHAVASSTPGPIAQALLTPRDHLQPTLAILPFVTARGHDGDAVLGDMISEELSRALSRSHMLDVISHLSCRNLDARTVRLDEIRTQLNTDYIVSGNYRTQGDRISLNADFIDAKSGKITWTRDLIGSQSDFLRGDETVVAGLAEEVGRAVMDCSVDLARAAPIPDVESHALLMSGIALMHRQSVASFARARTYLEEVAGRVPKSAVVQAWLGKWYVLSVVQGWSNSLERDAQIASDYTARALDLNPECSFSMSIDGFVHNNLLKRFDLAMDRYADAIEIDPNNALAWLLKGTLHAFTDQGEVAVSHTDRARALSPLDPHRYFFDSLSATANLSKGNYRRALELANRSLRQNRRHVSTLRVKVISLQELGHSEEARLAAEELMRLEPGMRISRYLAQHPAAQFNSGRSWANALKAAGVPA